MGERLRRLGAAGDARRHRPLDESFFLYCEDVDWSLRARRAAIGWYSSRARWCSTARPHRRRRVCRRAYFLARNGLLFARKHGTWRAGRVRLSAAALALPLASLLRRALAGEPLAPSAWVARGVLDGFLGRPPRLRQLGLR